MAGGMRDSPPPFHRRRRYGFWIAAAVCFLAAGPAVSGSAGASGFFDGGKDAIAIATSEGSVFFAANKDTPLVPASILKLLTALVAIDTLGPDYRFPTEFRLLADHRLQVTGYGDPLFISEVIDAAAARIVEQIPPSRNPCLSGILLNAGYFAEPLVIPGVSDTANPYDAPNGALCANFNTVYYSRNARTGTLDSAEPQTPLLPFAASRIGENARATDRVVLSHRENAATQYTGHLLKYFIQRHGCRVGGGIELADGAGLSPSTVHRFFSPFPLTDVISRMMAHSNNFMANQLLIAAAAAAYGPPGTLTAAARLANGFARNRLDLRRAVIVEGSGISRGNRISAGEMITVLTAFFPYRQLLRREGADRFKTGTLKGIQTRAGYLTVNETPYAYVVMLNSGRHRMHQVMQRVTDAIQKHQVYLQKKG